MGVKEFCEKVNVPFKMSGKIRKLAEGTTHTHIHSHKCSFTGAANKLITSHAVCNTEERAHKSRHTHIIISN